MRIHLHTKSPLHYPRRPIHISATSMTASPPTIHVRHHHLLAGLGGTADTSYRTYSRSSRIRHRTIISRLGAEVLQTKTTTRPLLIPLGCCSPYRRLTPQPRLHLYKEAAVSCRLTGMRGERPERTFSRTALELQISTMGVWNGQSRGETATCSSEYAVCPKADC